MVSLEDQIKCVQREIALRHAVYPKRVLDGKMKQEQALYELDAMYAVLETLKEKANAH